MTGGAWTFRVPKANSQEFWKEVLMMAIGEILQEVVERGEYIVVFIRSSGGDSG
jgi:hypothetical protein